MLNFNVEHVHVGIFKSFVVFFFLLTSTRLLYESEYSRRRLWCTGTFFLYPRCASSHRNFGILYDAPFHFRHNNNWSSPPGLFSFRFTEKRPLLCVFTIIVPVMRPYNKRVLLLNIKSSLVLQRGIRSHARVRPVFVGVDLWW